jgi:hypothetical protein
MTNLPIAYRPCDFPLCSVACWTRCDCELPCWDGRPAHWYREVWKVVWRHARQADMFASEQS